MQLLPWHNPKLAQLGDWERLQSLRKFFLDFQTHLLIVIKKQFCAHLMTLLIMFMLYPNTPMSHFSLEGHLSCFNEKCNKWLRTWTSHANGWAERERKKRRPSITSVIKSPGIKTRALIGKLLPIDVEVGTRTTTSSSPVLTVLVFNFPNKRGRLWKWI